MVEPESEREQRVRQGETEEMEEKSVWWGMETRLHQRPVGGEMMYITK